MSPTKLRATGRPVPSTPSAGLLAAALIALILAPLALSGCEITYLARAAYEEGRLLWNRRPIDMMLSRNDLSADMRAKLETVLKVREFARDRLGLKVGGAYLSVSEVDAGAIVWVVMAAPRTSLQPVTWWFPIVGRVPYRGYFDQARAKAEAQNLEADGFDTFVRPAVAFSTLGFFDDPLLSNLLHLDHIELAGVIIHELFHRTFFLESEAMFDETAATYVGSRGAVEFFAAIEGPDSAGAASARSVFKSDLALAAFLLQAQARLLRLYQSKLPTEEILKRRTAAFAEIEAEYAKLKPSLAGLERFELDKRPLNNAVLINYLIYFHELWNFVALGQRYHGDLRSTIAEITALAKSDPSDPFYAIWQATRTAPPATP